MSRRRTPPYANRRVSSATASRARSTGSRPVRPAHRRARPTKTGTRRARRASTFAPDVHTTPVSAPEVAAEGALPPSATERRLAAGLVRWFEGARRALPWRDRYEPYAVWIAEMMLQQTQVETVLPYYGRWMERFPTVAAVAQAPLEAVLKAWEGLGYYGRARNLHRTARALVERHGGRLPADPDALRALPGVGPYTAGAIASIAFNRPVPVVDGNVARVLGRLFAHEDDPASPEGRRAAWTAAAALLAGACAGGAQPRACNEALMELGALVCRPRSPQCLLCPWLADCRARLGGDPEAYPPRRSRKVRPVRRGVMLLARRPTTANRATERAWPRGNGAAAETGAPVEREWLLRRRPPRGVWGGLWEFPWAEQQSEEETQASLCAGLAAAGGVPNSGKATFVPIGHLSHGLTHFQLELECLLLEASAGPGTGAPPGAAPHVRWVARAELMTLPLARLSHKALALVES